MTALRLVVSYIERILFPNMAHRFVAFFLAGTLPLASFGALPAKYVGIWATPNSVFNGDLFLGGFAFYVDKDGTAVLLGGPLPPPNCDSMACAKVSAMKMHADLDADKQAITLSSKDPSGHLQSGVGFIYDAATNVLYGKMSIVEGKTLLRKVASVSPELMRSMVEAISQQEKDIPAAMMTYVVPSRGMDPTLKKGQIVLADTNIYKLNRPQRGDIIAYESVKKNRDIFIQRVVGLPGDTVEIRETALILNGEKVPEPYAPTSTMLASFSKTFARITVPQDAVFLLGDNRDNSLDSRFQGAIALKDITGRVYMVKPSQFEGEFTPIK